jgi:Zn-finger nucleic acid-binding protein
MHSPICPDTQMHLCELEPGLAVYECPRSGGRWIPLRAYLAWREHQAPGAAPVSDGPIPALEDDSKRPTLVCPESGRLLLRYRVGHGLPFHIDRSPATGGVWLDKGEWEALRSKGLHAALHLIFTAAYQRQARSADYDQTLTKTYQERIGAADFATVAEFASWLARHPRRRDILSCLLDKVAPGNEADVLPAPASAGSAR